MVCAYVFLIIALISLPSALSSGNLTVIIAWLSSNFLQLVLLPIIIVGQRAQSAAADKRSEQTYQDAEALLDEVAELQRHLTAQDGTLSAIDPERWVTCASPPSGSARRHSTWLPRPPGASGWTPPISGSRTGACRC